MSEVKEHVHIVNKEALPEELAEYAGLGIDEQNRLVGLDEEGNPKRIQHAGRALIELALKAGIAEEAEAPELTPEIKIYVDQLVQPLNDRIEALEESEKELKRQLGEKDVEIKQLKKDLEKAKGEEVQDEEEETLGEEDDVALKRNGKYQDGYEVVQTNTGKEDKQVLVRNKLTDDEFLVDADGVRKTEQVEKTALLPAIDQKVAPAPLPQLQPKSTDRLVDSRPSMAAKLRARTGRGPQTFTQYRLDEYGRAYVYRNGQPVLISEHEISRNESGGSDLLMSITAVAACVAAAASVYHLLNPEKGSKEAVKVEHQVANLRQDIDKRLDHQHNLIIGARNTENEKLDGIHNRQTRLMRMIKHSHRHERLTLATILRFSNYIWDVELKENGYSSARPYRAPAGSYSGTGPSNTSTPAKGTHFEKLNFHSDNIWNHVAKKVREQLKTRDTKKIAKATNYVLRLNNITADQATKMSFNYRFRVPNNLEKAVR